MLRVQYSLAGRHSLGMHGGLLKMQKAIEFISRTARTVLSMLGLPAIS